MRWVFSWHPFLFTSLFSDTCCSWHLFWHLTLKKDTLALTQQFLGLLGAKPNLFKRDFERWPENAAPKLVLNPAPNRSTDGIQMRRAPDCETQWYAPARIHTSNAFKCLLFNHRIAKHNETTPAAAGSSNIHSAIPMWFVSTELLNRKEKHMQSQQAATLTKVLQCNLEACKKKRKRLRAQPRTLSRIQSSTSICQKWKLENARELRTWSIRDRLAHGIRRTCLKPHTRCAVYWQTNSVLHPFWK